MAMASRKRGMERGKRCTKTPLQEAEFWCGSGFDQDGFTRVFISETKGYGVFTTKHFPKSAFLLEYVGEVLIGKAIKARERLYSKRQKRTDYPRCYMYHFKHNEKKMCIDATAISEQLGRLVNDAQEGTSQCNAQMKRIALNNSPKLALFSTRPIEEGEEILYDYGEKGWWRNSKKEMVIDQLEASINVISEPENKQGTVDNHESKDNIGEEVVKNIVHETEPSIDEGTEDKITSMTETEPAKPTEVESIDTSNDQTITETSEEVPVTTITRAGNVQESLDHVMTEMQENISESQKTPVEPIAEVKSNDQIMTETSEEESITTITRTDIPEESVQEMPVEPVAEVTSNDQIMTDTSEEASITTISRTEKPEESVGDKVMTEKQESVSESLEKPAEHKGTLKELNRVPYGSRDCDIIVTTKGVKPVHLRLEVESNHVLLYDSGMTQRLNDKDSFKVMNKLFKLTYLDDEQANEESDSDESDEYDPSSDSWAPDEDETSSEEEIESASLSNASNNDLIPPSDGEEADGNISEYYGNILSSPKAITIQRSLSESKRSPKLQSCTYCEKLVTTMSRHLERKHSNEREVARALLLPKNSKERRCAWMSIAGKGNYNYNCQILEKGHGMLIPKYRPRKDEEKGKKKYLPCDNCYSFFVDTDLWKHKRTCPAGAQNTKDAKGEGIFKGKLLLPLPNSVSKGLYENVLVKLRDDEISHKLKSDKLIIKFGERLFEKVGHLQQNAQYISQRMRQLSRLLLEMNIQSVEECLAPENWESLISGVKSVAEFNEETGLFNIPSMPLKLGHSLQKCAKILKTEGTIEYDQQKSQKAERFLTLFNDEWNERVSAKALETLHRNKFNKPTMLPTVEDISKFHGFLNREAEKLRKIEDSSNYFELAEVCLAQIICFNRKRSGEAERIMVKDYEAMKNSYAVDKEITKSLSKFEIALLENHFRIEIRGKKGSKVPILLTQDMKINIDTMLAKRSFHSRFLFAKAGSRYPIRGTDAIRKLSKHCGCKNPELIQSTNMRKQLATISQVLNLTIRDQDLLAKFLGHSIDVHREYYRLPQSTLEIAKVSKILHAVNEGNISHLQGKSLDEIQFKDTEIDLENDDDAQDVDNEDEGDGDNETLHDKCQELHKSGPEGALAGMKKKCEKRYVRRPWNLNEKAAIQRHMKKFLEQKTLPGKKECEEVRQKEEHLRRRSWKNIKDFVRNCNTKHVKGIRL